MIARLRTAILRWRLRHIAMQQRCALRELIYAHDMRILAQRLYDKRSKYNAARKAGLLCQLAALESRNAIQERRNEPW